LIFVANSDVVPTIPATENRTVPPKRHLTPAEVDALIEAAKRNRYGRRDVLMIQVAYRHGLWASELVDLEWSQVDFDHAVLHIRRNKKGTPATDPLQADTLRALRKFRREAPNAKFVFLSERGTPFSRAGFIKMVERAGEAAKLGFKVRPVGPAVPRPRE
jgi:integrase